jgi:hypothetical protein
MLAQLALKDCRAMLAQLAQAEQTVKLERQAQLARQAQTPQWLDQLAHRVLSAQLALLAYKAISAQLAPKAFRAFKAMSAPLAHRVCKVMLALQVQVARMVKLEPLDQLVHKVKASHLKVLFLPLVICRPQETLRVTHTLSTQTAICMFGTARLGLMLVK